VPMKWILFAITAAAVLLLCARVLKAQASLPLDALVYKDKDGKTLPYRLMKPVGYDPSKKFPLVVFLHGGGERGTDNQKQMVHGVPQFASKENREQYPCFLIAPQCPEKVQWVDVDWKLPAHTIPMEMTEPTRLTMELIEAIEKEFSIDKSRIYITGLSMGGFGTWDLLARYPHVFAAAVPICGGADEATAAQIKNVPIWAFHGAKDGTVQIIRSRNMVAALEKAGGKPKYTEYPDVGHDSWNPAYKDAEMFKWLFAQKKE
jgi:predicted peptidase